jgi:hypothetical protein
MFLFLLDPKTWLCAGLVAYLVLLLVDFQNPQGLFFKKYFVRGRGVSVFVASVVFGIISFAVAAIATIVWVIVSQQKKPIPPPASK